ncbi:MAG: hypothetical protein LPK00_08390 [Bacillaceae bacterium]|nr:hypothetical protein [Bacillaceae bacterium]
MDTAANIWKFIRENRYAQVLLAISIFIGAVFYFRLFFSTGIYMDETFLKKVEKGKETHYIGKSADGHFHISVLGKKDIDSSAEVVYRLPNNIVREYTVAFKSPTNWDAGIDTLKDNDGYVHKIGYYEKDHLFLFDKDGEIIFNERDMVNIYVNNESRYNRNYSINLKMVADVAYGYRDTFRGKPEFFVPALLLLGFILFDMRFPLFFFYSRNILEVRDPEPSDLYLLIQRITWNVAPIIVGILLIIAVV